MGDVGQTLADGWASMGDVDQTLAGGWVSMGDVGQTLADGWVSMGEHTVLQPFRRIEFIMHIAISVLPGTHFHLSQVKHLRVKYLVQGHNIETMFQD